MIDKNSASENPLIRMQDMFDEVDLGDHRACVHAITDAIDILSDLLDREESQ